MAPRKQNVGSAEVPAANSISLDDALEQTGFGYFQYKMLLLCGIVFASDALVTMQIPFLQAAAKAEWHLDSLHESVITSAVFGGEIIGAMVWGPFADEFGRRPGCICTLLCMSSGLV
jgi:MFS family permease